MDDTTPNHVKEDPVRNTEKPVARDRIVSKLMFELDGTDSASLVLPADAQPDLLTLTADTSACRVSDIIAKEFATYDCRRVERVRKRPGNLRGDGEVCGTNKFDFAREPSDGTGAHGARHRLTKRHSCRFPGIWSNRHPGGPVCDRQWHLRYSNGDGVVTVSDRLSENTGRDLRIDNFTDRTDCRVGFRIGKQHHSPR
jgi:hypothetical protein